MGRLGTSCGNLQEDDLGLPGRGEARYRVNERLRRALFEAQLTEQDLATELRVDPKTVRRWLDGRLPYSRHRGDLVKRLGVDEVDLWPELAAKSRPDEIAAIYPRRSLIGQEAWLSLLASAAHEIDILAYSALFLCEDDRFIKIVGEKVERGVRVKIALGDPERLDVARIGAEEAGAEPLAATIRKSIERLRPLVGAGRASLRLHDMVLYNSLYRVDGQVLVNQHAYGTPSAQAPVYHLRKAADAEMFELHLTSLEQIWSRAMPVEAP